MRSPNERWSSLEDSAFRELRVLEEVDQSPELSQRGLARRVGVALGVANLLLRRLSNKGYVKVTRVGWKRWIYALTPAGVALRVSLTLRYIDRFMHHYQRVRGILQEDLGTLGLNFESRVAIYGTSQLAELVYLALRDLGIEEIEVVESEPSRARFLGMPVRRLDGIHAADYSVFVLAASGDVQASEAKLLALGVPEALVVAPMRNHRARVALSGPAGGQG